MANIRAYASRSDNTLLEIVNSYNDYYQSIGNDLTVTLPSSVTDVFDALMGIVQAIANIAENPLGVLSAVTNAVTK